MFWKGRTAIEGLSGNERADEDFCAGSWSGRRPRGRRHVHGIDAHRLGDVLETGLAEIGHRQVKPRFHLTVRVFGKADRAGRGDAFEPGGDIDSVAHQVAVALFHDVADMDADPELDATLRRQSGVALDHAMLHLDRAAHRVDRAAEFDQRSVAGALDDATVMHGDRRVDEIASQRPQPSQGPILVRARQTAVAHDVGCKNRRQFPQLGHVLARFLRKLGQRDLAPEKRRPALSRLTASLSSLCGGISPAAS